MSSHKEDFTDLELSSGTYISLANGDTIPVAGIGTVTLTLGNRIVREHGWLYVPDLAMRLKSVRLHRRLHPDAYFLATNEECILGYPTFSIDVDDSEDCVVPCSPAPPGSSPDFVHDTAVSSKLSSSVGMAFQAHSLADSQPVGFGHTAKALAIATPPTSVPDLVPRPIPVLHRTHSDYDIWIPTPKSVGCARPAIRVLRPQSPTDFSSRDVPAQYVPDSAAPSHQRFTNEQLHKLFGNRRIMDWQSVAATCQGGKITDFGETPLSIGDFVNIKRGKRSRRKSKIPRPGHTICVDIGFGDGISPGGHKYCLVVVDAGSRMCWCYGLRDLSGSTICDAFLQLFTDMGTDLGNSPVRRMLTDFDTKLISGQARQMLLRRGISIRSSSPYRQSQNGLVESHWATGVRMARAYLQEANLPRRFWFWAIRTAFERMNMIPIKVRPTDSKSEDPDTLTTPFELFYHQQPDMRTLFPFGCVGYFRRETDSIDGTTTARTKFQSQTCPGIALGRSDSTNGMLFWSPETCRFSHSADYKLDTEKQVRTHWPELLNDGGFTINLISPTTPNPDNQPRFAVGNITIFQPEGPCTSDGEVPYCEGVVMSVPLDPTTGLYRVEMRDGALVDLPEDSLMDPLEMEAHDPFDLEDPSQGDPVHTWRPAWLKHGQDVTYNTGEETLIGQLKLSDNFRWAFTQTDSTGHRALEIELPNLGSTWKEFLDSGRLHIGHLSPPATHPASPPPTHSTYEATVEATAASLPPKTTRSGAYFHGHGRHVSAKGLTLPTPRFLWQSMQLPPSSPDYQIWKNSYTEEHDGLTDLDTYTVIDEAEYQRLKQAHGIEAIPTMCIHTVKPDERGLPDRAKSRTVVLGNEEHRYWEKNDVYAPVITKHGIRALVAYALSRGRRVKQCDAKNAFCQPTLPDDEICVVMPPKGCPFSKPGTYWRLKKTLYGLRRSPRHWYKTFSAVLEAMGLTKCPHDPCIFIGKSPTGGTIYFGTYVDDCAYFGTDNETEQWFEQELGSRLKIDFMGDLSYYLGVHYEWGQTEDGRLTVHMSQEGQIYKMLLTHDMDGADSHYPVKTPFRSGLVIDSLPHDGTPPDNKPALVKAYQSIVGGLNWLSLSTRPDITAVTSLLASHLKNPSQGHLDSAHHVLKYLKGSMDWGMRFTEPRPDERQGGNGTSFDPQGCLKEMVAWPTKDDGVPPIEPYDRLDSYSDSNWGPQDASHPKPGQYIRDEDVKSLLGAVATYMGGPVDWRCERESRISPSVCESEIKAMSSGHKMIMGLRHLFDDLQVPHIAKATPFLYCDNQGAVTWVKSESVSRNMRQYNIKQCGFRDSVRHNEVAPVHIPGALNPADLFTKEMRDAKHFLQLRGALMSPRILPSTA